MGEAAARRKAKVMAEMQGALEQAHTEGQGVWSLEVFHCSAIPQIMFGAACGDRRSHELAVAVKSIAAAIVHPALGKANPTLCMTCDTAFTPTSQPPEAFAVVRGDNPDSRQLIISVLCAPCDRHPDVKQRVFDRLRNGMITDLREIHVGEGGHA